MRSHTVGTMTLGKGIIYGCSTKQKLNTKSSIEAELVGIDDVMPIILWVRYFMEAQGFVVNNNIVHQDNTSTMKIEENGRSSSGKRTSHINIRYYFVTDRIKADDISVKYCPTEMMIADFFTKPLQGKSFRIFRNLIMNISDEDITNFTKAMNIYIPKNNCDTTPGNIDVISQEYVVGNKENMNHEQKYLEPYFPKQVNGQSLYLRM